MYIWIFFCLIASNIKNEFNFYSGDDDPKNFDDSDDPNIL